MIDSITFWKYVFALEIGLPTLYLFLRYYFKKDKQVDAINNRRQQDNNATTPMGKRTNNSADCENEQKPKIEP